MIVKLRYTVRSAFEVLLKEKDIKRGLRAHVKQVEDIDFYPPQQILVRSTVRTLSKLGGINTVGRTERERNNQQREIKRRK